MEMINERYLFQSVVGEGTFGQTVKAIDRKTNEPVAVKRIKYFDSCEDINVELKVLGWLNRSSRSGRAHIVTLLDMFIEGNRPFYVFEFLPCTLGEILKVRKLKEAELRYVGYALIRSASFFSSMGIVHADLKPDNIMFTYSGELKVVDFGMSFFEKDRNCDLCQTRSYRAPEVCLFLNFGCAIDMWSIGCILAECHRRKPLIKSKNELHHLQLMTELFGMFPKDMIEECPVKCGFFANVDGTWRLKESGHHYAGPSTKSMPSALHIKKNTPNEVSFVDLLNKMFRMRPEERLLPVDALMHPFFERFEADEGRIDLSIHA